MCSCCYETPSRAAGGEGWNMWQLVNPFLLLLSTSFLWLLSSFWLRWSYWLVSSHLNPWISSLVPKVALNPAFWISLLSSTSFPQLGFEGVKRRNWTFRLVPRRRLAFWKSVHFGCWVGGTSPGEKKKRQNKKDSRWDHLFLEGRKLFLKRRKKQGLIAIKIS